MPYGFIKKSHRLKGYRGLHYSLSKVHNSYSTFKKLKPHQQRAWSAFDSKRSRRINFRGGMAGGMRKGGMIRF